MNDIVDAINYIGIPTTVAIVVVGLMLILQIVGEIVEACGKIVPEFFKIRKYFKRKKDEKQEDRELVKQCKQALDEFNVHYSTDNIGQRDQWIAWVNSRAAVYDGALNDLRALKDSLTSNNELTLDLYINVNRNRIIDFAGKVANEDVAVSREEFNRIFKVYNEYESILKKHNKTNGEVDIAYRIITEAYATHMKNHTFLEDIRGYNK